MQYTLVGKIALLALLGCLTLSGCGFKGALYLPEKDTNEVTK